MQTTRKKLLFTQLKSLLMGDGYAPKMETIQFPTTAKQEVFSVRIANAAKGWQ